MSDNRSASGLDQSIEKYAGAAEIFFRSTPDEDAPIEAKALALAEIVKMSDARSSRGMQAALSWLTEPEEHGSECSVYPRYIRAVKFLEHVSQTCYDGGCGSDDSYDLYDTIRLICLDGSEISKTPREATDGTEVFLYEVDNYYYAADGSKVRDCQYGYSLGKMPPLIMQPNGLKGNYAVFFYANSTQY